MTDIKGIVAGTTGYFAGLVVLLTLSFSYGSLYRLVNFDLSLAVLALFLGTACAVTGVLKKLLLAPAKAAWLTVTLLSLLTLPLAAWIVSFMNVCASDASFPIPGLRC